MSNIKASESLVRSKVLGMVWQWTYENFHKLSDVNKMKIAIPLMGKNIPQEVEGEVKVTMMPDIKINGKPLEYNIGTGSPRFTTTGDALNPGEITTNTN